MLQVRAAERDEVMAGAARARPVDCTPRHRQDRNDARRGRDLARRQGRLRRAAARPAPGLGRGQLAHRARCATTRPAPTRSTTAAGDADDPGLHVHLTFDPQRRRRRALPATGAGRRSRSCASRASTAMSRWLRDRPGRLRRLRRAHDRPAGRAARGSTEFKGFVACGGFSYGDMLGAGEGWARIDPVQPAAGRAVRRASSTAATPSRSASATAARCWPSWPPIIPGAAGLAAVHAQPHRAVRGAAVAWSRCSTRRRSSSPAWPAAGIPIAVAHGEGFADFSQRGDAGQVHRARALRRPPRPRRPSPIPYNPNGSPDGLTAVTTADGRFTALMPHPERVFRNVQMSWTSGDRAAPSPWMRMFRNARRWVG